LNRLGVLFVGNSVIQFGNSLIEYQVGGLPLHILLIHAVVIFVPLTAVAVVLHGIWPAARRRLGFITPAAGAMLVVLVPVVMWAGEWLRDQIGSTDAVARHEALGRTLLPWVVGLFIVGLAEWLWFGLVPVTKWGREMAPRRRNIIRWVLVGLGLFFAIGSVYDIILIGDSGARAVWGGILP
jgi:hypothetical protein